MTKANATTAAVLQNGRLVGYAHTTLPSGPCCWGYELLDGGRTLVQCGSGRISRAKAWLKEVAIGDLPEVYVNIGGGGAM